MATGQHSQHRALTGFAGLAATSGTPAEMAGWLQPMSEALVGGGHGVSAVLRAPRYAASGVRNEAAPRFVANDDGLLLLAGAPRFADPSLRAAWHGADDGDALLARFADAGRAMLESLRGPYALVSMRADGDVLMAVDRMGIGDLYWTRQGGRLVFGTSLPAVAACPGLALETDPQALYDYLYFHMIPAPETVYRDVRRLPPGGFVHLKQGEIVSGVHSRVEFENESGAADVDAYRDEFRALLESGVRDDCARGTSVGSFLSGGTDSSTVTGYLGQVSGAPARSFSIGFDESGFDEMSYAHTTARHFGAEQHEYYVTPADIAALAPRVAGVYGQPFGNSSVIPAFYCARLARENGVQTMLAGDGGDELFGGNTRYVKQKVFEVYGHIPALLRNAVIEPISERLGFADAVMPLRKLRRYVEQARVPLPERLEGYNLVNWFGAANMFHPDFLAAVDTGHPGQLQQQTWDDTRAQSYLNRMLALDFKYTLADNDLRKVNSMCALAGVDVGYPLLSDDLVDFSARLPTALKVKGPRLRYFFKEALKDFLPAEVISKSKHGFGLPFGSWVLKDPQLRALSMDALSDFRRRRIVRTDFIDSLTNTWLAQTPNYYGALVWLFMILEFWHQGDACRTSSVAA